MKRELHNGMTKCHVDLSGLKFKAMTIVWVKKENWLIAQLMMEYSDIYTM